MCGQVGSLAPEYPCPDFEVQYRIGEHGAWTISGGREGAADPFHPRIFRIWDAEGRRSCDEYAGIFAEHLIMERTWEGADKEKFRWEVDEVDLLDGDEEGMLDETANKREEEEDAAMSGLSTVQ